MPVDEQGKRALSSVRYAHAQECLQEAESLLADGQYKGAANLSYYAVFHAIALYWRWTASTGSIILA